MFADFIYACEQAQPTAGTISGTLPVMYIETENRTPITSKTVYLNANYWLAPQDNNEHDALGSKAEPLPMQIRGRGHSSWKGTKKPYKIKFDKKTSVLVMADNKHFAILKPSENTVAGLQLGKLMNMAWTPSFRPIEVVLNGDYIGLYFLTETIRIDKNRVNIYEQNDQETDPDMNALGKNIEWFYKHLPAIGHTSAPQIPAKTDDDPVKVFNLQGICIGEFENELQAINLLYKDFTSSTVE